MIKFYVMDFRIGAGFGIGLPKYYKDFSSNLGTRFLEIGLNLMSMQLFITVPLWDEKDGG